MLLTLFISVTGLLARLSEEFHCCRLTEHCLVPPLCAYGVSVYLKHSRLRFHKGPYSAWVFQRGVQKFMSHETALSTGVALLIYCFQHKLILRKLTEFNPVQSLCSTFCRSVKVTFRPAAWSNSISIDSSLMTINLFCFFFFKSITAMTDVSQTAFHPRLFERLESPC